MQIAASPAERVETGLGVGPGAPPAPAPAPKARWAIPLAVVAAVLVAGLDSPSGGSITDERLYLSIVGDLRDHGLWFTPTLEGVPDFTKPPLLYWAGRASLALFGVSLWAARLPVAISALLLALVAWRLGRRFAGERGAVRALLLVGTCLGVLRYGRLLMMDIPLALAVAVGVEQAWAAATEERPWALIWTGLAAGVAALLKGPVGPFLVFGITGLLLLRLAPRLLRSPAALAALGVAAVVGLPWFIGMAVVHGRPFVDRFLWVEHVGKFGVPWSLSRAALLVGSLALFCLPWVPLVRWRGASPGLRLLAGVWAGTVLLVFLVPGYKMQQYVVPALVPVLLLAACPDVRRWAVRVPAVLMALLGLLSMAGLRLPFGTGLRLALLAQALLLAGATVLLWRGRVEGGAVAFAGAAVLAFAVVLPAVNPAEPRDAPWPGPGNRILVYRDEPVLLERLFGRPVRRVKHWDQLLDGARPGDAVVMPAADVASLPPEVRSRLRPAASWRRLRSPVLPGDLLSALERGDLEPIQEGVQLSVVGNETR
jgi:4-amino-4-deoxy-L-arabinose transferase-like glycosyltransferase